MEFPFALFRSLGAEWGNSAFSGKVETGFPSENAPNQEIRAFQRFRETVKCSSAVGREANWTRLRGALSWPAATSNIRIYLYYFE